MSRATWLVGVVLAAAVLLCPRARAQPVDGTETGALEAAAPALYKAGAGPCLFDTWDATWRDEARGRDVPVRVYTPRGDAAAETDGDAAKRFPVVIFSHGLGGSREGYRYIAEHLASHGYIVILPSHAGSDRAALREFAATRARGERGNGDDADEDEPGDQREQGWLRTATHDPDNLRNRPRDVSFIIDQLSRDEALAAVADPEKIAVAGHSFGAYTAMAAAGMLVDLPGEENTSFHDPRIDAAIAMSPQGAGAMGVDARSWSRMSAPVLFLTGTRDYGQGDRSAAWRREAFDRMQGTDAYLAILEDASHFTFSGRIPRRQARRAGVSESRHEQHLDLVRALSTAFLDAQLRGDEKARQWLHAYMTGAHDDCEAGFRAAGAPQEPAAAADAEAVLQITVNAEAAPDLAGWGEQARALCEKWHPLIAAELATEGFTPPTEITIVFRERMRVPAAAGGGVIQVSAGWVHDHPDDLGMIAHELTHLIQAYPNQPKQTPGWITEGIADYIRFYKYEPGADRSRIDPERSNYDDSYRTTARFLDYLVRTRDPDVVRKLNAAARAGECDEAKVREIFGADPAELWKAFLAAEVAKSTP